VKLWALVLGSALSLAGIARAQSTVPRGPADIMNQANAGRDQAELQRAVRAGDGVAKVGLPDAGAATTSVSDAERGTAVTPPSPGVTPASPHSADDGHDHGGAPAPRGARDPHKVLAEPTMPVAEPMRGLAPGTIQVEVVGTDGQPVAGAEIVLGVMQSLGGRTEQRAKADAAGRYTFQKLSVGSTQAYRVNVLANGAKFSSTPFRLPEEQGYVARIPVLATTSDTKMLFQMIGQTVVELRDDRLHVTQQAKLANAGDRVIVLPKDGLTLALPPGYTAFNWQEQMSDQKGEELAEKGFRIRGSLPPGTVTLAWTFDLPRTGESAKIVVSQPWRTYQYRVISEAPPGLKLRVSDFPEAEQVRDKDRDLLYTQIQNSPNDTALASFTIKLDGIPGPGPGRWIALVLAVLTLGFGAVRAFQPSDDGAERKLAIATRKRELLALAKQTEGELERGEIGPNYRAEKLEEIVTELALVLRDEESLAKRGARA
jgi:hypothetical protein